MLCDMKLFVMLVACLMGAEASLMEFNNLVTVVLRVNPGVFIGYGNYCGNGNLGGQPVDKIDECCEVHDNCYHEWFLANNGLIPHDKPYTWHKEGDTIFCDKDTRMVANSEKICECDYAMVQCVKTSNVSLNPKFYTRMENERKCVILLNEMMGRK